MDGPTDGPTDGQRDCATKKRLKSFRISRYWKRRNWTNWLSDYEKMCAFFSFSKLIGAANSTYKATSDAGSQYRSKWVGGGV